MGGLSNEPSSCCYQTPQLAIEWHISLAGCWFWKRQPALLCEGQQLGGCGLCPQPLHSPKPFLSLESLPLRGNGKEPWLRGWYRAHLSLAALGTGEMRGGNSLTAKGWPHGEVVVIDSEQRLRFSWPDFGHVRILFIQVTAKKQKCLSMAHQGTGRGPVGG